MKCSKVLIVGLLVIALGCNDTKEGVSIVVETEMTAPPEGLVLLYSFQEDQLKVLDTLAQTNSGNYKTRIIVNKEGFYRVSVFNRKYSNLILNDSETKVVVKFDGSTTTIVGSEKSLVIKEMDDMMAKLQRDMKQLSQEAGKATQEGDNATVQAIIEQYNSLQEKNQVYLKKLVRKTNPSLAAIYGLKFLDIESDFSLFDSVVLETSKIFPENFLVNQMADRVDKARVLAVGQEAPDFTLPDTEGVDFSLSDLRGKYVLLDFWAAWCKPCRAENPNVVRMYTIYGGDQFEILGISLDRTKEAWLKAITDDGLKWKHVSDLKRFNSEAATLYDVNAIPATFLIDPEGNIIGKNLRGPSLEAKLQDILGS